jgi:cytochrome P450 family 628
MSELRTVIAKLILEFDMSFAPGEDGRALLEDSEDVFTTACAKLELVFTPRKE